MNWSGGVVGVCDPHVDLGVLHRGWLCVCVCARARQVVYSQALSLLWGGVCPWGRHCAVCVVRSRTRHVVLSIGRGCLVPVQRFKQLQPPSPSPSSLFLVARHIHTRTMQDNYLVFIHHGAFIHWAGEVWTVGLHVCRRTLRLHSVAVSALLHCTCTVTASGSTGLQWRVRATTGGK